MTPLTGSKSGKVSISSCLKCEKVISVVDQLTRNMHEFEIVTMEMEFDIESAKSKSDKVLSNFWQLISMIKSITITDEKEEENGTDFNENPNSAKLSISIEKHEVENQSEDENEPVKARKKERRNTNLKVKPNPTPNVTEKRRNEIQRANRLLRTIKCETAQGFYNLFECIKCQRQFNNIGNARYHVQVKHLCLGAACSTCFVKYFDRRALELHIPKCPKSKKNQLQQIKIWLKNDSKNPVKVRLQSHQKQQQKQKEKHPTPSQNSSRKIQNQHAEKNGQNPVVDLSRLKVRNPYPNFSIVKAMNVNVVIQRLEVEKHGETSSISRPEIQNSDDGGN